MGRRTNLRLAQSKPPPSQGFRGFDRQRQNLGLHRLRAAAHQEISLPITLLIRLRFGHLVALTLLLVYAPIGDAFAGSRTGHESRSKSSSVQLGSGHSTASRHHALGVDGKGTYYSQLLRDKSEWRQARRRGSTPSAADRDG